MLEAAPGLATKSWGVVTNPFVVIGDRRVVSNAIADGNKFYRVRQPVTFAFLSPAESEGP